jgi:hypothetical protein
MCNKCEVCEREYELEGSVPNKNMVARLNTPNNKTFKASVCSFECAMFLYSGGWKTVRGFKKYNNTDIHLFDCEIIMSPLKRGYGVSVEYSEYR